MANDQHKCSGCRIRLRDAHNRTKVDADSGGSEIMHDSPILSGRGAHHEGACMMLKPKVIQIQPCHLNTL